MSDTERAFVIPADSIVRMDLVGAVSTCPPDLAPTHDGRVTDLRVRLG